MINKPPPTPMVVYSGTFALGEIKDYGPHCIMAYVYIEDRKPLLIGTYPDRKAAIGAVAEAAEARKRLAEPAPAFKSGLPEAAG